MKNKKKENPKKKLKQLPQGMIKIQESLLSLIANKNIIDITTAEIAEKAGVTEGLIYKYFKNKRNLLYHVLRKYLEEYFNQFEHDLKGIEGSLNKLRKLIWVHFHAYSSNRVFGRALIMARNHESYYKSENYDWEKSFGDRMLKILEEGVANGEIIDSVSLKVIRQLILGSIENISFAAIMFNRELSSDTLTNELCTAIFSGISIDGSVAKNTMKE